MLHVGTVWSMPGLSGGVVAAPHVVFRVENVHARHSSGVVSALNTQALCCVRLFESWVAAC
jgi:hypothetical protein